MSSRDRRAAPRRAGGIELFDRAKRVIPGGVSSPARAFGLVGGDPVFAQRGEGAYLYGSDGRRYVDYIQGFGAILLGHADKRVATAIASAAADGAAYGLSTPTEVRLAELVCELVPSAERVRFLTSGTEAGMTAARIARAATGRTTIVKFEGCYHGHADAFLAKAGSGVATFSVPSASGVPPSAVADTITLPFNDLQALEAVLREHRVAAVFVEPMPANMGVVRPEPGFLEGLTGAARRSGTLVVADEVVTGFRLGLHGCAWFERDLTMLGKVLGGGLPVGAVCGPAELMDLLSPLGPVYQAGTYAAHPHAMAAGVAVLETLSDVDFAAIESTAAELAAAIARDGVSVVRAGTILSLHLRPTPPRSFAEVNEVDRDAFARFHRSLREAGVLIAPSPFEAWFPSLAHGSAEVATTIDAVRRALDAVA